MSTPMSTTMLYQRGGYTVVSRTVNIIAVTAPDGERSSLRDIGGKWNANLSVWLFLKKNLPDVVSHIEHALPVASPVASSEVYSLIYIFKNQPDPALSYVFSTLQKVVAYLEKRVKSYDEDLTPELLASVKTHGCATVDNSVIHISVVRNYVDMDPEI